MISLFRLMAVYLALLGASVASAPNGALKQKIDALSAKGALNHLQKNTVDFYVKNGYQPLWIEGSSFKKSVETVLATLSKADEEGLQPEDYAAAAKVVEAAKGDAAKQLEAEITLTGYAMEYIDDLMGERLNPRKIGHELYLKAKDFDAVSTFLEGMKSDESGEWLAKLTVQHPEYQLLKKELAALKGKKEETPYPLLEAGPKLEAGNKGGRVEKMQWQLVALGYLSNTHQQGVFDEATEIAIKKFQEENDLEADGVVGGGTVQALNSFNQQDRLRQLLISMERWRWLPDNLGDRYVKVNIAAFELACFEKGEEKIRMPVIIGRTYRKTPVFASEIRSIVFNPSWHVPRSIAIKDKIRKIQRDPGYLERGGFVVSDEDGNVVDPSSVDWGSLGAGNFPYRLRQNPGSGNALGKIKFNIDSPFDVYLHSTNEPELFKKNVRSLSSGCIRVENPKALGAFVFNDPEKWSYESVSERMEGTRTQEVKVEKPVHVYITYFTAWANADGKLHYSPDLYGQDQAIWTALKNRQLPVLY